MNCEICGIEIDHSGQFCRMCGSKIIQPTIHKKEVLNFFEEKLTGTDIIAEDKKKYQNIINRMNSSQFKEVEVYKTTFGEDLLENLFESIITEKDGKLEIHCDTAESFIILGTAYLFSEMESFHNEMAQLNMEIHNDRIAKLNAAMALYRRALATEDIDRRRNELDRAAIVCTEGLETLKKEIESRLEFFSKLPKSTIKKIFHGFSIQAARANLKQIQEAYKMYCNGVQLLLAIDIKNGEPTEKILQTVEGEWGFLKKMYASKGYARVLEIDDENTDQWKEHRSGLSVVLHSAKRCIETDHLSIKVLED